MCTKRQINRPLNRSRQLICLNYHSNQWKLCTIIQGKKFNTKSTMPRAKLWKKLAVFSLPDKPRRESLRNSISADAKLKSKTTPKIIKNGVKYLKNNSLLLVSYMCFRPRWLSVVRSSINHGGSQNRLSIVRGR